MTEPARRCTARGAALAVLLAAAGVLPAAATAATPQAAALPRLVFAQVPVGPHPEWPASARRLPGAAGLPDGSRIVAFDPAEPQRGLTDLTPAFVAAGRPDLSFDGQRLLFVGRRTPGESFAAWEMAVDGSAVRRVTAGPGGIRQAIYLSTTYSMDVDAPYSQIALCATAATAAAPALYTCRLDGSRWRQITFTPLGAADPALLIDGRLLFSSLTPDTPSGAGPAGTTLFTVNTDGTDVFVFAAAQQPTATRGMACDLPGDEVLYVESVGVARDPGGLLLAVRRSAPFSTRRVVADDPQGLYHSPAALPDGRAVVSWRPRRAGSYGLHVLDVRSGRRLAAVYDASEWHDIEAVALRPRPVPAGHSSLVDDDLDSGSLYCMNAYLSDTADAAEIAAGDIRRVQVLRALAEPGTAARLPGAPAGGAEPAAGLTEELLGDIPVEADGSFFARIPARTPLRLRTLDGEGRVLQNMGSWMWVMPREARGCIGCHEDRELSPPNRHVLALRKGPHLVGVEAPTHAEHTAPATPLEAQQP